MLAGASLLKAVQYDGLRTFFSLREYFSVQHIFRNEKLVSLFLGSSEECNDTVKVQLTLNVIFESMVDCITLISTCGPVLMFPRSALKQA